MPLKLTKRKGVTNWYVRGTVRGQNVFETAGTDSREAAETYRIKRESELLHRSVFGAGATVTFAEAAVSYVDAGGEKRFLGTPDDVTGKWSLLIGHFGSKPIARIGQVEADEAARAICPTAGPATRKRHVYGPLSAVLNHAAKRGWCARPRLEAPRVPQGETKWAAPEWFDKLLPFVAPRLRRLILVLPYTGARLSEALRLNWDHDVSLARRTITFRRTKTGRMRTVRIADALLIELASVPEAERHGRLFLWSDKCHVYGPLRNACRRAGVPYLSPHQLGRHTYATWLRIYAKRDLRGLMEDGGWDSIASVVRYAHTVPGETAVAVDSLPTVHSACSSNVKPVKDRRMRRKIA